MGNSKAKIIKELSKEFREERFLVRFKKIVKKKIPCGIFFGLQFNEDANLLVRYAKALSLNLICVCVVDDVRKEKIFGNAKDVEGVPIVNLDEFPNSSLTPSVMFHMESTAGPVFGKIFKTYGIEFLTFSNTEITEKMFNFHMKYLTKIYETYEMLSDEESKKAFVAFIKGKLSSCADDFIFAPEPQYFFDGFIPGEGDISIDGGAFDGATARDFAKTGAKVYAFEMSEENYKNCLPLAEKYNFTIENFGLSDRPGEFNYTQNGAASHAGGGTETDPVGKFINLDTYVAIKNLPRVDYVKLDIEGAELLMLQGAANTLIRCKPKMAVSAYHKWEDVFTLPAFIKSLHPDYEFKFRHYRMDCTDYVLTDEDRSVLKHFGLDALLPTVAESVLYCR